MKFVSVFMYRERNIISEDGKGVKRRRELDSDKTLGIKGLSFVIAICLWDSSIVM